MIFLNSGEQSLQSALKCAFSKTNQNVDPEPSFFITIILECESYSQKKHSQSPHLSSQFRTRPNLKVSQIPFTSNYFRHTSLLEKSSMMTCWSIFFTPQNQLSANPHRFPPGPSKGSTRGWGTSTCSSTSATSPRVSRGARVSRGPGRNKRATEPVRDRDRP